MVACVRLFNIWPVADVCRVAVCFVADGEECVWGGCGGSPGVRRSSRSRSHRRRSPLRIPARQQRQRAAQKQRNSRERKSSDKEKNSPGSKDSNNYREQHGERAFGSFAFDPIVASRPFVLISAMPLYICFLPIYLSTLIYIFFIISFLISFTRSVRQMEERTRRPIVVR